MSNPPEFSLVTVPTRIADLEFTYLRPADFRVIDLPVETPNFEDPTTFYPLQVIMASYGAVLFTVVARPAFSEGTVQDWAEFLAQKEALNEVTMKPGTLAGIPALIVDALNPTEAGTMRMRTALLEDGGRFLNLSVMAPAAIWQSVEPTLLTTMSSFRLAEPRGSTTPLTREEAAKRGANSAPRIVEHSAAAHDHVEDAQPAESVPATAAQLAIDDHPGTLDPAHPLNARLRDNGAGLTPRVLEVNAAEKYAVIGAGAIVATFKLPFGWHVIDDGRRSLVFDAAGKIQISLNLRRADENVRGLLEDLVTQARDEQPQINPLMVDFGADLPGVVLRNYRDGEEQLVQAFVAKTLRDDGLVHVARVTAAPDKMTRAMNLAEVILRSLAPVTTAVPA